MFGADLPPKSVNLRTYFWPKSASKSMTQDTAYPRARRGPFIERPVTRCDSRGYYYYYYLAGNNINILPPVQYLFGLEE
jgi:hypothetical protein